MLVSAALIEQSTQEEAVRMLLATDTVFLDWWHFWPALVAAIVIGVVSWFIDGVIRLLF